MESVVGPELEKEIAGGVHRWALDNGLKRVAPPLGDRNRLVQTILERYGDDSEVTVADGFERAFLGVGIRCGQPPVAVYDWDKAIQILIHRDGMDWDTAVEHMEFNVTGAWVGADTPMFINHLEVDWNDRQPPARPRRPSSKARVLGRKGRAARETR